MRLRSHTLRTRYHRHKKHLFGVISVVFFASLLFFLFSYFSGQSSDVATYTASSTASGTTTPEVVKQPPQPKHIKTPEAVRAVYMTSWVAGTPSLRSKLIDFIEHSEINSVVIDIKDATGKISFEIDDPLIKEMGSSEKRIADIDDLINHLHAKNIYVIGRVSVFQDPYIVTKRPNIAVQKKSGGTWHDRKGLAFVDAGAEWYWDYVYHIAKASEQKGFDEINFDYVRYPSDGALSQAVFTYAHGRDKQTVIESFFKYIHEKMQSVPATTSADLFGLTIWAEDDLGIGQVLEKAAPYFDYIAPMTYPSHYDSGFQGFKNPAAHPYEVIHDSLQRGIFRMQQINEDPKKLRPWIQDFDLGAPYGVPEVQAQKKAIYDLGLRSWMSWDASNKYTKEAYSK